MAIRFVIIIAVMPLTLLLIACGGEKSERVVVEKETEVELVIRHPAHAGKFYPGDAEELKAMVEDFLMEAKSEPLEGVIAITTPHAGYVYSGKITAEAFKSASHTQPDTIILIGPYHYAPLTGAAVFCKGTFLSPLGTSVIDEDLVQLFIDKVDGAYDYPAPHYQEHSLENQLPFIHHIWGDVPIVPIILNSGDKDFAKELGEGLLALIQESGKEVLIVSTVDLSHYYPIEQARVLDEAALSALCDDDPLYIVETNEKGISAVDAPLVFGAVNYAARELGVMKPSVLRYGTSADFSGDESQVVGYSAVVWSIPSK